MKRWAASCIGMLLTCMASTVFATPTVVIETTMGQITLQLDQEHTPITTKNFLAYIKQGFYSNTLFHRVIDGFMIQGGGLAPGLIVKPTNPPIDNEGRQCDKNTRGTIAMARTGDPHSATAQFFINLVDNPFLDFQAETRQGWGYCAFGQVTAGMEVVDNIRSVATTSREGYQDVPVKDVVILDIHVLP